MVALSCSGATDEPSAARTDNGTGDIVFITRPDFSSKKPLRTVVNAWNADPEHEAEQVTLIESPPSSDAGRSQLVSVAQEAARGGRDCYDVMTLDMIWTAEFARFGYIVPLDGDEFDISEHIDRTVDTVEFDGITWAVPFMANVGLLYYRKDLVADPPRTQAALMDQAITRPPPGMEGYAGQFFEYEGLTVNALEIIRDYGGDLLAGDSVVTEPAAVEAALRGLRDGIRGPSGQWISPHVLTYREEESRHAFEDGEVLFLRHWPYAYTELTREGSALNEDQVGVTAMPWESVLGGHNLAVSSCSKTQGTARHFIQYLTRPETQKLLFIEGGYAPTRADVYDDREVRDKFAYVDLVRDGIATAVPRPKTPYYGLASRIIQDLVSKVLNGESTPAEAVDQLDQQLTSAREGRVPPPT